MVSLFDTVALIQTVGYVGLWFIIFAESGLFIGFFLPGDSLLFTAGFLASEGFLDIGTVVLLCFTAAVLGDNFGYTFGRKIGPKIFQKKNSIVFNQENVKKAQLFYEKYGGKTIVLARFLPVIRTFAPILAGVGHMKYRDFFAYNIFGGILWAVGLPILGYWLGVSFPQTENYIVYIIGIIIFFSAFPQLVVILRNKENRRKIIRFFSERKSNANEQ